MKQRILVPLLLLSLAACDDNKTREPGSAASLPPLSAGSSQLLLDGDDAGPSATAFVADGGAGYLVLQADSDEPAAVIYRRSKGGDWRRVPAAPSALSLTMLHSEALPIQSPSSPDALAGGYRAVIAAKAVAVVIAADGRLSGGAGGCRLGGALDAAKTLGHAVTVKAKLSDCGDASGDYAGIAWADAEAPNAVLRMVLDDGRRVQDFFLFRP